MDAAEYKHIVLGLIFVKCISDTFQTRRDELTRRFADANDDYFLPDATAALLADELEDRDYYKEVNVFWVPEAARWESLRAQADIGKRIDVGLLNAKNVLGRQGKNLASNWFTQLGVGHQLSKKLALTGGHISRAIQIWA